MNKRLFLVLYLYISGFNNFGFIVYNPWSTWIIQLFDSFGSRTFTNLHTEPTDSKNKLICSVIKRSTDYGRLNHIIGPNFCNRVAINFPLTQSKEVCSSEPTMCVMALFTWGLCKIYLNGIDQMMAENIQFSCSRLRWKISSEWLELSKDLWCLMVLPGWRKRGDLLLTYHTSVLKRKDR